MNTFLVTVYFIIAVIAKHWPIQNKGQWSQPISICYQK